ncbi:MAG: hypothetical protein ABI840_08445, partial [bacterium]
MKKVIPFFSAVFFLCISFNLFATVKELTWSRGPGVSDCDIRIVANNAPAGTLWACGNNINTLATIKNVGALGQMNIKFSYTITGPVSFSDSIIVASLGPDSSLTVSFGSFPLTTVGSYTVFTKTSVACDSNS